MGSVGIFLGLSGIVFHFFLALAAVCVVVLRRDDDFHLALLLWTHFALMTSMSDLSNLSTDLPDQSKALSELQVNQKESQLTPSPS